MIRTLEIYNELYYLLYVITPNIIDYHMLFSRKRQISAYLDILNLSFKDPDETKILKYTSTNNVTTHLNINSKYIIVYFKHAKCIK